MECQLVAVQPAESLWEALGLGQARIVSLVGAGGKTTTMYTLACERRAQGVRVVATTTTHIARPDPQTSATVTDGNWEQIRLLLARDGLVTVAAVGPEGKLAHPGEELLDLLRTEADLLLLEADGSRRLPVKMIGSHEPVLVPDTERIIAVAGLSAIGRPFAEACHRPELATAALKCSLSDLIQPSDLARLLLTCYGRWGEQVTYLLNQADDQMGQDQAAQVAATLAVAGAKRIAVASLHQRRYGWFASTNK